MFNTAVLVAIAIPVFSAQLERSKEATDLANVRAAYATLVTEYIENNASNSIKVKAAGQKDEVWSYYSEGLTGMKDGSQYSISVPAISGGSYSIAIDADGSIKIDSTT